MKKPTPFGKYFLLERINVGGMAEVFRAKAFGVEGFERLVAVKRILPNIAEDKEFIRMFIDEAKLSVQLNHANVAQIFDLGVVDGAYYIALEHVHGRDLRGIFDRCRQVAESMPVAQACFVTMKMCEGLDYAHNKRDQGGRELQLVHRDVSPQNVLVSFEGEVKIIDFGIAKAAGKGSKTQAGILKGKFGYMSPEQVRGLPVDRRSDVFSAGIVLYELLTGERLFVGESDFSTLEKVRNVEILPPSTYNRKIPDELERIVLKALAKDVEDRYQNAIDLHDELQAFVYTAGEFYSRKDLAGWMKKTFAKEIEEETAKLETYRALKPPPAEAAAAPPRPAGGSRPPTLHNTPAPLAARRSTGNMPTTKPPPPPSRSSGQIPIVAALNASGSGAVRPRKEDSGDLAWDDDELETQIYDNPEDDPKNQPGHHAQGGHLNPAKPRGTKQMPSAASAAALSASSSDVQTSAARQGAQQSAGISVSTAAAVDPDLSSLVSTSKGWEKGPSISPIASPAATLTGVGLGALGLATNGTAPKLASGSNKVATPQSPSIGDLAASFGTTNPLAQTVDAGGFANLLDSGPRESAVSQRLVSQPDSLFDPMGTFGSSISGRRDNKKGIVLIAVGGAVVAALAVVAIVMMTSNKKPEGGTTGSAPMAAVGDQNTGFDLYILPAGAGVTQWKLDGEARTDRLPSRIRGIAPGTHRVQIEGPNGFLSHDQQVKVELGKAGKVEIALQAMQITGEFESDPKGAQVSLIVDGKRQTLGPSPATAPLDPKSTYQVLFEMPGFVSVNRPVVFDSSGRAKVTIKLEPTGGAIATNDTKTPEIKTPEIKTPEVKVVKPPEVKVVKPAEVKVVKPEVKVVKPVEVKVKTGPVTDPNADKPVDKPVDKPPVVAAKGSGMLTLGSKPPCEIFIDGSSAGNTPKRDIKLSVGRHKITLVNNEFGIKETFAVDIKADATEKMIKDYSDRLPK